MSQRNRIRTICIALGSVVLGSCGSGTFSILGGGGGSGGGGNNSPTVVSDVLVGADATDAKTSPVTFTFRLTDADSDPADVDVLYTPPGGGALVPLLLTGNTNLDGLATSPAGVVQTRQWDFAAQLASAGAYVPGYRITVRTRNLSSSAVSALFAVGNDAPVVSGIVVPPGETSGIVPISFTLADSSSDLVSVTVEYQNLDDPTGWHPATSAGGPLTGESTTPSGVALFFFWDAPSDMPQTEFHAILRFTPDDGTTIGASVQSPILTVDNNTLPAALVNGSAFYATPDQRRGIPLPIRVIDPEGDTVRVVVQWRTPFGTFPTLPDDPAALAAILANPRLRRTNQIATESPIAYAGPLVPAAASTVRLGDIRASQSGILAGGLAARSLEILRTSAAPAPAAAGWSANPLVSPVGLLSYLDGHSAIVLDAPSAGNWRLREIDLATGAVLHDIASGSGVADAIAYEEADSTVLVATDVGGTWTIRLVAIADGTTTTLITTNGTTALGTVYGLVSLGTSKALMTVENASPPVVSSLIAVDASIPATPRETLLATNLPTARGLALDPHNHNRLFIALREWVNPAPTPNGIVISIDLLSHASKAVTAAGFPFLHPDSIAIDERSGRLLVLTDDPGAAYPGRELRAVDLNGGGGGTAFQIAGGIPNGCQGLATGPDGLRMFAMPAANDLYVAGGVEQVRAIASFDASKGEATVTSPFAPALDPHRTWRIFDSLDPRPASAGGIDEIFVWDSADLLAGGDVVLRAVPYDAEQGLSTDTGVPRPVRPGLDVLPYSIGSGASTSAPSSIAMADLNGDGKLDLVTANVGADTLSVFIQPASGVFTAAPTSTLNGTVLATLTDPYSVKAIDVDGDGDLDLVSANHGSNNLIVWTQGPAGTFTPVTPASGGLSAPSDVAGADLNRDGRMDLVVANTGAATNAIAIYFRSAAGTYPLTPSTTIGGTIAGAPVSVAVGDIDGDGDIDIVSANQSTNNITIFHQSGPGVFPAGQVDTIGGPGITDGPSSVALGDINGDGQLDIVCADRTGNDLTVFIQNTTGGFASTPTFTLAASGSPLQPTHVELADVNDDGALDLICTDGANDISIFVYQPDASQFAAEPIMIGQGGPLSSPSCVAVGDFDGDGHLDLAATNATGNNVAVFQQLGGASYNSPAADLVLGNALATSNPNGIAIGDIDGDGDLDIVSANQGANDVSVFEQISPSIFGSDPVTTIGSSASTNGVHAVALADLDGDGRLDIVTANQVGRTLAIFHQSPTGGFASSPDVVLGGGTLGTPSALAIGDLDGDGDLDIVSANTSGNNLSVFFQAPNGFIGVSPVTLGSGATTKSPVQVLAVDIDRDGDLDLVCVDNTGSDVTIFLNPGNGAFPAVPSRTLGSSGSTPSVRYAAVGDLDGDGDLDIVVACGTSNTLAVFLQSTPGNFPAAPSFTLSSASLITPDTVAVADIDHDGDLDIVSGNTGSRNLTIFRQGLPGVFAATPLTIGGAGWTNSPRTLCLVDLDGDGDIDLVTAEPTLDNVAIYFGSH